MGTLTSWNPLGHSRPVMGLPGLVVEGEVGRAWTEEVLD